MAILGIVGTLGIAYLSNDVNLWIQQVGLGEADILSPVDQTQLSIQIEQIGNEYFITACNFTSVNMPLLPGTKLYCKLYNSPDITNSLIIATGFLEIDPLGVGIPAGTLIPIPINMFASGGPTVNANLVKNVLVEVQNPPQ
jgi:hypothetical protein